MLYISIAIFCIILILYIFRNNIIMNIYKLPLIRKTWQLPDMAAATFEIPSNNTKPVVVCCGDSITHGHIGYDWVSSLRNIDKSKVYINAGINADLTWNLNQRIDDIIKHHPDYVTILIGTNDAIGSENIKHIQDYYVSTKGLPRLPHIDWYASELEKFIIDIQSKTNAKIAISTLSWLGEQSEAEIIKVVRSHNNIIRDLSAKYNLKLIDLFKEFDQIIDTNNSIPYTTTEWRRLRGLRAVILHYVFGWSWNRIGRKYKLKLLCDHIHLNEKAGVMLEELMKDFIDRKKSTPDRI
jgi:lysophospholipase L1-like esterase